MSTETIAWQAVYSNRDTAQVLASRASLFGVEVSSKRIFDFIAGQYVVASFASLKLSFRVGVLNCRR